MNEPEPLDDLPGIRQLIRLTRIDSTQTLGRRMAGEGAPEGTLIWAERQSQGRGRMNRKWASSAGGLYVSLILRPAVAPKRLAELSLAAADAVANAVNDVTGLKTAVKAPNDVLALPAASGKTEVYKKICGILLEASGGARSVHWVVLGIGLNVNNKVPKSIPSAASILELSGQEVDLEVMLSRVIHVFMKKYRAFLTYTNGHIEKEVK